MMPAFYLILVGLIGLAAVLSMKESKGKDLLSEDAEDLQSPGTPARATQGVAHT
ncbi:hypothetical protein D3C85_1914920 [compost metagenome]